MDQLNQKLLFSIPDPIFSRPNVKEKIAVWLRETKWLVVNTIEINIS